LNSNLSQRLRASFISDAKKVIGAVEPVVARDEFCAYDLKVLTIHVHGVKAVLFNIGESELSKTADALETAARAGHLDFIRQEIDLFIENLKGVVASIEGESEGAPKVQANDDSDFVKSQLQIIKTACDDFDIEVAQAAIESLRQASCSAETLELLRQIEEYILVSDFDAMEELLSRYLQM